MSSDATPGKQEQTAPVQPVPVKPAFEGAGFVSPRSVALVGVLTALTTAVTMSIAIPFPPTRGFFNLGDAIVFFTAVSFGWRAGAICGGIGSAAADILLGYGYFAPITFITKGTEGLVAGAITGAGKSKAWAKALGIAAGGVCMVLGYFLGEWVLYGVGPAILEVPVNIAQVSIGGTLALALTIAVSKFLSARGMDVRRL